MQSDQNVPNVLIRADAGERLGNGHVMRCLVLGQAMRERGGQVSYLGRLGSPGLERRLRAAGVECTSLESIHPRGGDLEATLAGLAALRRRSETLPWLILDGYHFDPEYQRAVRQAGWPLLVVDDAMDRSHYSAAILLNQNLNAERLPYRTDPDTLRLLGIRHVLLRSQFLAWKGWERPIREVARRILVTLGGGDRDNVSELVLEGLLTLGRNDLVVTVISGSNNPHLGTLEEVARRMPFETEVVRDAPDMPERMTRADVAITAAGSTSWELAFLGLPALLLVLADNQRGIAGELDRAGVSMNMGWFKEVSREAIGKAAKALLADRDRRRAMSLRGRELVDGGGAGRVAEAILLKSAEASATPCPR